MKKNLQVFVPRGANKSDTIVYKTYDEFLENIDRLLKESWSSSISLVCEIEEDWGEWFELWKEENKQSIKVKETWM